MKNTPKKGQFRHIVFKDKGVWYAVALELNIVESGEDAKIAYFNLLQATEGYIQAVAKVRGTNNYHALNQTPAKEYETLWAMLHATKPVKSPYQIGMYGVSAVHA